MLPVGRISTVIVNIIVVVNIVVALSLLLLLLLQLQQCSASFQSVVDIFLQLRRSLISRGENDVRLDSGVGVGVVARAALFPILQLDLVRVEPQLFVLLVGFLLNVVKHLKHEGVERGAILHPRCRPPGTPRDLLFELRVQQLSLIADDGEVFGHRPAVHPLEAHAVLAQLLGRLLLLLLVHCDRERDVEHFGGKEEHVEAAVLASR